MNKEIELLYIEYTKKCNSKCITCDYWKNKNEERILNDDEILNIISYLDNLKVILFTGGEALIYSDEMFELAEKIKIKNPFIELRLLTNGFLVSKNIDKISKYFDTVVFSFDADNKDTYFNIRGVDWFDKVVTSIKKVKEKGLKVRLRCMVLEENYLRLDKIIKLANDLNVNQISFIPLDSESIVGFERNNNSVSIKNNIDINLLENEIKDIILNNEELIDKGVLTENGNNLRNIIKFYKKELHNIYCNSPYESIVLQMDGKIKNCFFTSKTFDVKNNTIDNIFNSKEFINIRKCSKNRELKECEKCVL